MSKRTKYNQYKQLPEVNVTDLLMKIGSQCLIRMLVEEANEQEISPIKKLLEHEAPDKKYNLTYKDLQLIQHLDIECKYLRKHMIDRLKVLGEYYNLPLVQIEVWCVDSVVPSIAPCYQMLKKCVATNNLDAFKYFVLNIPSGFGLSYNKVYNIASVGKCSDCFMWIHQLTKCTFYRYESLFENYDVTRNIENPNIVKKLCKSFEDFKDYHLKAIIIKSSLKTDEQINLLKKFYGTDIPPKYLIKLPKKYPGISLDQYRNMIFRPLYHRLTYKCLYYDLIDHGFKFTEEELLSFDYNQDLMGRIALANLKKHGCTYQSRDIQIAVVEHCYLHYDYNYLGDFLDSHNSWDLLNPLDLHLHFRYVKNDYLPTRTIEFGNLFKRWIKSDANTDANTSDVILHVLFGHNEHIRNMAKSVLQLMK
jgi:hypothetical protein